MNYKINVLLKNGLIKRNVSINAIDILDLEQKINQKYDVRTFEILKITMNGIVIFKIIY